MSGKRLDEFAQTHVLLLKMDILSNETHLMINTTKNIIKRTLEYIIIPKEFFFFRTFRFSIQN